MTLVSSLLLTHSHYDFYRPTWQLINDLKEGYSTLESKKEQYIPRRVGEEDEVYQNRLLSLSYTNVLNENVQRLCSILTSSPITLEYESPFWDYALKHLDGKRLTHDQLVYDIYSTLLYFKSLTIAVDAPEVTEVARSRGEYLSAQKYPKVTLFNPLEVINWGDDWVMTLQINEVNQPLLPRTTVATWKLWTRYDITTWTAEVTVSCDNVITKVRVGNKWYQPCDKKARVDPMVTPHSLGVVPVVRYQLRDEQWVGNAVAPKAKQHFIIESSYTWACRYAGVIQRLFTPLPPTPNDNPNLLLDPPDYSQLITDNAHVLIGSQFQFVETQGTAVGTLGAQLAAIKEDIKDTVNITFATGAKAEQSGVSKKVDLLLLQNALTSYGYVATEVDEQVLELIGLWAEEQPPEPKSNLSYSLEDIETALDQADRIAPHAMSLAPVTLREFFKRLQHLLLPDASDEVKQEIDAETPEFDGVDPTPPNATTPMPGSTGVDKRQALKELGLSEEEVNAVLGL